MARAYVNGDGLRGAFVALDRWREAIEHPEPALRKVVQELEKAADIGFSSGRRPLGNAWVRLSPAYAAYKRVVRPGRPVLTFDGDLHASLGSARGDGAIRSIKGNTMRYGTTIPYAVYHNKGTAHMPARPVLPANGNRMQGIVAKAMHEHIIESGK